MQTAELVALPLAERLQAMEALWDSLCREQSQASVVPTWHADELGKRMAAIEKGEVITVPWEEAKERIRRQAQDWANIPR
jgi:putative addiction module component (TIGR02574 family)